MKTFLKNCFLTGALVLCATGTARANQLLVFVTPSQLLQGLTNNNTTTSFGGICNSAFSNCGIWAVGFRAATGGTANQTLTAAAGTAAISPESVAAYDWVTTSIAASETGLCGTAGCSAFGAGGAPNTDIEFITNNSFTVGTSYSGSNAGGTNSLIGVAPMGATTDLRGIGFLLTFATEVAAGTTTNVTFQLLAARISATTGVQSQKEVAGSVLVNDLVLVALPEPSSVFMMLGGVFALSLAAWHKRRQLSDESAR